ncbi:VanZ family protein [Allomuricauda sp. SCSIO 65647]|uniref:VanZ family protein n=1 Tax=Allomuricauda sp. SCSIO 65647 TaxID=2908843 RepID=UPI001F3CCDF0|nr:VanZ family protein [Muricauda sp. SCSIO 65647]UJH68351.1 VanZ family protein [Muricauda sp. SCSIO 65647]
MPKRTVFTISFFGWIILVTMLSLFSFSDLDTNTIDIPYSDKIAHFAFYFGFVWLGGHATFKDPTKGFGLKKMLLWLFLAAVAYGSIIEVLQHTVTTDRSAEWGDFFANCLGALTAALLLFRHFSRPGRVKIKN